MKTLIVGGTGGIGGYIALDLERLGHKVTLAARNPAKAGTPVTHMPILRGSYVDGDFTKEQLRGFDNIVFSACNDIRQLPPGVTKEQEAAYYHNANSVAVPRFVALARDAGVKRVAYIGSFYPQARPDLVEGDGYIQSRKTADEAARALATPDFHVVSLNAPWVVGAMRGQENGLYTALMQYARGKMSNLPVFAMPGGVNYISVQSLSESVIAALDHGENGRGYLVGDENLRYSQFFEMFFRAAGNPIKIPVRDEAHPIYIDAVCLAGRAGTIFYEPEGVRELGYRQNDIERTIRDIAAITP